MDAHAAAHQHESAAATYTKIALVLFVMTALEVLAYEASHRDGWPMHGFVHPFLNEILIVLSAAKFALVAMFYMHLKQDSRLFSGVFVFPLIIATVVIVALVMLFAYLHTLHPVM